MLFPNIYPVEWCRAAGIPEYTTQWKYFPPKTMKDCYRKLEALIDFIRRKFNMIARR